MANPEHGRPGLELKFDGVVDDLLSNGYQETDLQYNIARTDGEARTDRIDLINPETSDRLLVVLDSDEQSEALVRQTLGDRSVLALRASSQGVRTYGVPRDAKLLSRVMAVSPYRPDYMHKLMVKNREINHALSELDSNRFGINLDSLVLIGNGDDDLDDVHISVVPPLRLQVATNPIFNGTHDDINKKEAKDETTRQSA